MVSRSAASKVNRNRLLRVGRIPIFGKLLYSNSGEFESYIALDFEAMEILPLPNGNYLIKKRS